MPIFNSANEGFLFRNSPFGQAQNQIQSPYDSPWVSRVKDVKLWHMYLLDSVQEAQLSVGDRISGQFTPQNFVYNLGSKISESSGYGRSNPIIQWVGGTLDTATFQVRLFSAHKNDYTAATKLEQMKLLCIAHEPYLRAPLIRFFWGNSIPGGLKCFVESIGNIVFDELRPDGSIRGVTLNITLKKFTEFKITRIVQPQLERTPTHVVKSGESYEMIAYRRWGDPMIGVPLRQQNPRFPIQKWAPKNLSILEANETIKLFPLKELTSKPIKPESHIFLEDNIQAADNRRYIFSLRSKRIGILPKK